MRYSIIFMLLCWLLCGANVQAQTTQDSLELDTMMNEMTDDGKNQDGNITDSAEEIPETVINIAPITKTSDNIEQTKEDEKVSIEDTVEEVLVLDVFSPDFMASLRICRKDSESKDGRVFTIKGMRNDKCHLTYGNYTLDVPTSLLSSIHGFDDLNAFLKNKDMARYKYLPEYTYEGLIFALNACVRKEKFYGVEEEENHIDAVVLRGLSAEYFTNYCEIYLQNELELEDETHDYSITCRLPQNTIDELEPFFADLVEKYENLKPTEMHQNKEVRDADIALMYYLQQNNYCKKNNEFKQ